MIRIVAISDTHCQHDRITIPPCDILIHAGDFTGRGSFKEVASFTNWLSEQDNAKHKVFIAGNHDHLAMKDPYLFQSLVPKNCNYLKDSHVIVEGLKIYGTPWTPFFYDWAFNGIEEKPNVGTYYPGGPGGYGPDQDHPMLSDIYKMIPEDTDILVCHGPPAANGISTNLEGYDCGSWALKDALRNIPKLQYGICGHIHEGKGIGNDGRWYNVSSLTRGYELRGDPITIIEF